MDEQSHAYLISMLGSVDNPSEHNIQLFQLKLSPSKAEKSNTSAKGLLRIAKRLMILLAIPSKPFALVFDFSALLGDNLN